MAGRAFSGEELSLGNLRQRERGQIRRALSSGKLGIAEVLSSVPECVTETPVHELIMAVRGVGPNRMVAINHDAMSQRVNLFLPVIALSPATKKWIVGCLSSDTL